MLLLNVRKGGANHAYHSLFVLALDRIRALIRPCGLESIRGGAMLCELCSVCQRVAWGEVVRLGFDKWRHESCYPGSSAWREAYILKPENERTEESIIIFNSKGGI